MIGSILALSRFMVGSRRALVAGVALAVLQAALMIPVALLLKIAFDDLVSEGRVADLLLLGAGLFLLGIGSSAVSLWTRHFVLRTTKDAMVRLRTELFEKLYALPSSWFDRAETGQVHAVLVQDSERVDVMANALAGLLAPALVISLGLAVAMVVINPLLFAVLVATYPLMFLLGRRLGKVVGRRVRRWQGAFDRFSVRTSFGLRAHELIRAHGAGPTELAAARSEVAELSERGRAMALVQHAYGQLNGAIAAGTAAVILVIGATAVADGSITIGALIAFYALVGLLRSQLANIFVAVPEVIAGGASLERLDRFLDSEEPQPYPSSGPGSGAAPARKLAFSGRVALRAVEFSYRPGEEVLRGVDLEVAPAERVALVGSNGAGKSTVGALLLGLYAPDRGAVLADSVPYGELDLEALRAGVAVVPQPPILFAGSVAENIAFATGAAGRQEIVEAARLAGADEFVRSLLGGYDSQVGSEGELLSGGQRQRIAIARALLRRPALLILDEPTAGLDRDATLALLEAIRSLPRDPAILLISHDAEVVAAADRVYELREGVVLERSVAGSG